MFCAPIRLVVFDIAGTTVRDNNGVLHCFAETCRAEGISTELPRLNALMGVSKLEVFDTLWREQLGAAAPQERIDQQARHSFHAFKNALEAYYRTHAVEPADGALEVFDWLREREVNIALNTGFYRSVTDIILGQLGWLDGLNSQYIGHAGSVIQFSICSDEVPQGRPAPYMIQEAMAALRIESPAQVVKVGDTPVDLAEGRNAGCALSLAVTNGSHSRQALEGIDNDGLLESLHELPILLRSLV